MDAHDRPLTNRAIKRRIAAGNTAIVLFISDAIGQMEPVAQDRLVEYAVARTPQSEFFAIRIATRVTEWDGMSGKLVFKRREMGACLHMTLQFRIAASYDFR